MSGIHSVLACMSPIICFIDALGEVSNPLLPQSLYHFLHLSETSMEQVIGVRCLWLKIGASKKMNSHPLSLYYM